MVRTATTAGGRSVVTFDDFSGGEYGLLFGRHAPAGSFTGQNVVRLQDGSLAPRSGLVNLAPTSVPTGVVLGFGYNVGQNRIWFVIGDTAYDFVATTGTAVRTMGTLSGGAPTKRLRSFSEDGINSFISSYGDKSYKLDHNAGTVTAITGPPASPGGRVATVYNDRMLVASSSTAGSRLYYSAAGDFTSWPAANYIDLGVGYEIQMVAAFRERVIMAKHDGSWWVLSGTPGVNDVLRRMVKALRVGGVDVGVTRWAMAGDGRVWFLSEGDHYPVVFGGSTMEYLRHLGLANGLYAGITDSGLTPAVGVAGLGDPADVFFCTGSTGSSAINNQGLLFHDKVWTKHTFGVSISGWVDGRQNDLAPARVLFCNGGSGGVAPKFYFWAYALNRVPFSAFGFESLGDASSVAPTCQFTTAEWYPKGETEVLVQAVAIDFQKWAHGLATNNTFGVDVIPIWRDGGNATTAGGNATTQTFGTFTEAATEGSGGIEGTPDRRRWTAPTAMQFADGFKIRITGMVGVAITRIHVFYDQRPAQGI